MVAKMFVCDSNINAGVVSCDLWIACVLTEVKQDFASAPEL